MAIAETINFSTGNSHTHTVDLWTLEAHDDIHLVVPRNSIMVSTYKQELQSTGHTQHVYSLYKGHKEQ